MKRRVSWFILFILIEGVISAAGQQEEKSKLPWQPIKPVTIIVPWNSGGLTDQISRVIVRVLEEPLGRKIVIQHRPGDSGSVGTKEALDARHDGYTWIAGAAADLGSYKVLDLLDTTWDDWELFLCVADVLVVAVNAETPYKTFDDLLNAFAANPGQITVATAGPLSAGHDAIEAIAQYAGVEFEHVLYRGGDQAANATVAGEAEVVAQLCDKVADLLRAGELRALAVLAEKPHQLAEYGEIPPITNWIEEFEPSPDYFGIWIPRDTPEEVIETFGILWDTYITSSQELSELAASRGVLFDPQWGEKAKEKAMPYLRQLAWSYHAAGKAAISPETIGIPEPR